MQGLRIAVVASALFGVGVIAGRAIRPGSPEVDPAAAETERVPPSGLEAQLLDAMAPASALERASAFTVLVETPWGLGSGYLATSDCEVVTSRRVVDPDRALSQIRETQAVLKDEILELKTRIEEQNRLIGFKALGLNDQAGQVHAALARARAEEMRLTALNEEIEQDRGHSVVRLADGSELETQSVLLSELYDLALLRIDAEACPSLEVSTRGPAVGQEVYAIGSPMGLELTVTGGVISSVRSDEDLVQTDVPINAGSSGGPLIDSEGHLVGINTMRVAGSDGLGFAIPAELVQAELARLKEDPFAKGTDYPPEFEVRWTSAAGGDLLMEGPVDGPETWKSEAERKLLWRRISVASYQLRVLSGRVAEFLSSYERAPKELGELWVGPDGRRSWYIERVWVASDGALIGELHPQMGDHKRMVLIPEKTGLGWSWVQYVNYPPSIRDETGIKFSGIRSPLELESHE